MNQTRSAALSSKFVLIVMHTPLSEGRKLMSAYGGISGGRDCHNRLIFFLKN